MKNRFLDQKTAHDIDKQIEKILRGLGNPEPPLSLPDVLALLKLDKQYYSSQDDSALREFFSKGIVAGKQIVERPSLLLDLVRKWDLKALYVPDRRRILIDQSQHELKWRWNEAHEIIHSVIEWHQMLLHGDNGFSLSPDCHEQLEAEANYGAGRLICFQDRFTEFARSEAPSFSLVKKTSKYFGNTITSSLWRLVEALDVPALGIVSQHPHYSDATFNADDPCRYFIRSPLFAERFSKQSETGIFEIIRANCSRARRGPLGNSDVILSDDRGEKQSFNFEAFHNGHQLLSLFTQ